MTDTRQRLGRLPLERRVKFLALLRSGRDDGLTDRPTRRERGDSAPLSYSQDLLWFLDRLSPGMSAYNVVSAIWLRGPLDTDALRAALAGVVDRHETLRTSLRELSSGPAQVIEPSVPIELTVTDVDGADPDERRAAARELAGTFAQQPFELGNGPLWRARVYRIGDDEYLFAWIVHHAVFDGTSSEIFARELAEFYGAVVEKRGPNLPELPLQFADFAIWQREWLSGKRLDKLLSFWRETLREPPVLELPTDRPRPSEFSFRGADSRKVVGGDLVTGAHRLAGELAVTPYPVYVAAFLVLLRRYSNQDDLVVGCSTSVRGLLELENLLGFFVNMMALRVDVSGDPSFRDLVGQVDQVVKDAFAHVDLPFERVVQAVSPVRDPSRSPLVQVNFLLPEQPKRLAMYGLEADFEQPPARNSKFDMTWQMYEAGDRSSIDVEYSTDLFDAKTIENMQSHYAQLLTTLVDEPDRPVSRAVFLPRAERDELVNRWNGPRRDVPATTIDRWFAEQVAARGDEIAVIAGKDEISYRDLDERSNRIAWLLRSHGATTGTHVALCLPRGIDYVATVLGTLKAGAAFVPLDPASPPDRMAGLIGDFDPRVVLTNSGIVAQLPADGPVVLAIDGIAAELAAQPAGGPPSTTSPEDCAYIIYTSGSTGTPKGVVIDHSCVVNFIGSTRDLFELTPADNVLAYASYTFDVSVFEMFSALLTGARLHVALDTERLDVDRLQQVLREAEISVIDLPPSVMALLEPSELDKLRIAFVGGEAFSGELVNRWNTGGTRFFNGYGPTECTVTMIVQECDGHWEGSPPIGLPMANHVAHVLDENLQPVPYGVPGELVIGGRGLASGYLNRPELTEEKFVPDPFGTAPGGRLYRTGDLVKRRPDGAIVFLGRVDRQIKIRGVRIEPGEVEAILAVEPGVRQTFVEAWTDNRSERHLVAYIGAPAEPKPTPDHLRSRVAAKLPATMVPQYIVVLDELPLTSSGKVDTKRLPSPSDVSAARTEITAPRTETEKTIADELFGPALKSASVDVVTSFFELGGSSLQAAQLLSGIRRRFEVDISVADFFRDSTVAGLALVVDRQKAAKLDDNDLLDMLEQMSDNEVERMMGGANGGGADR